MTCFLKDLETKLRRQQESSAQMVTTASALAVNHQYSNSSSDSNKKYKNRRAFCSNGVHNSETSHSEENCYQLHPEKAVAFHQAAINRVNGTSAKRALLSVNTGVANAIVLDSGASGHYLKYCDYFSFFTVYQSS